MTTAIATTKAPKIDGKDEPIREPRLRGGSEFNMQIVRLFALMREARDLAEEMLKAGHSRKCKCDYCKYTGRFDNPTDLVTDIAGLVWAINAFELRSWEYEMETVEQVDERERRWLAANS